MKPVIAGLATLLSSFFIFLTLTSPAFSQGEDEKLQELEEEGEQKEQVGQKRQGEDHSELFKCLYESKDPEDRELSKADIKRLKQFKIILIPGFMSDFTVKYTPVGYFREAKKFLSSLGLKKGKHFDRVLIKSQSPSDVNLRIIAAAVRESPKKVLIIGHSKGSLDALKTLVEWEEVKDNVAGLITIQGPFGGSDLADEMVSNQHLKHVLDGLLRLTGGNVGSLEDFTTWSGTNYLEEHAKEIENLEVPILNFASSLGDRKMSVPILRLFHSVMKNKDVTCDGLVPTQSALIPGCPGIVYMGLDHTDPVVSWGKRGKQKIFLETLLKIFLTEVLPPEAVKTEEKSKE